MLNPVFKPKTINLNYPREKYNFWIKEKHKRYIVLGVKFYFWVNYNNHTVLVSQSMIFEQEYLI